jgi:hypothetical protein
VGRRDYFRQLIFLTFAPISIILFSLHLLGSYGLTIKPALALLKLAKAQDSTAVYDKELMAQLDKKTCRQAKCGAR